MPLMNNITKTLKETFKPRKRRAAIGGILGPIMIVVIVIAGVGVLAAMFFDLADTASIVDSIEISNQAIYSEQGFVTVQVKNGGNTGIDDIYAVLLVANKDGSSDTECAPGIQQLWVTQYAGTTTAIAVNVDDDLSPGESITISGGLQEVDALVAPTATAVATITPDADASFECISGALEDRGEYVLQVNGWAGDDVISKTVTVRAQ